MAEAQPFAVAPEEAIAFLRDKLNVPTQGWTDVWEAQHDKAFMVAGAQAKDLLEQFHQAVNLAIAEGRTLEQFRDDFDTIVAENGWSYHGSRNWRSRVIFETNIRTSYAAGRSAQIERVKDKRPYLRYVAVLDDRTRPAHRAWHDTILAVDHPFWDTHFPPNGWGCRCTVQSLNERDLKRYGLKLSDAPPDSPLIERAVKGRGIVLTPEGIDPGFGYHPGKTALPPPKPPPFTPIGPANIGGAHPKEFWADQDGAKWLFKPAQADGAFIPFGEEAASRIGRAVDPAAVEVRAITLGGKPGSVQKFLGDAKPLDLATKPADLSPGDLAQLQSEHVVDWAISNHDGHIGQFIRTADGKILGIDKAQALKHLGQDKLAVDYHPNAKFGEKEPFYNILWRAARDGEIDPDLGKTFAAIDKLQAIPDADYRLWLQPYAAGRFKTAAQAEAFLDQALARKASLKTHFEQFFDDLGISAAAKAKKQAAAKAAATKAQNKAAKAAKAAAAPGAATAVVPPAGAHGGDFNKAIGFEGKFAKTFGFPSTQLGQGLKTIPGSKAVKASFSKLEKAYLHWKATGELPPPGVLAPKPPPPPAPPKGYPAGLPGVTDINSGYPPGTLAEFDAIKAVYKAAGLGRATTGQSPAVRFYTGSGYAALNNKLRNAAVPDATERGHMKALDKLINGSVFGEDVVVYRGVRDVAKWANLQPGDIVDELGYASASFNLGVSVSFARYGSDRILFRVRASKGAKAHVVSRRDDVDDGLRDEAEVLFGRGQEFLVKGVQKVTIDGMPFRLVDVEAK